MASEDPKIVIDAILAEGNTDQTIKVYPVTIRRYALLEKLDSPFINPDKLFNVDNIIPSMFVMTRSIEELKQFCNAKADVIRDAAFVWSENLLLDDIPKMVQAITDQFLNIQKAAPDAIQKQDIKKN